MTRLLPSTALDLIKYALLGAFIQLLSSSPVMAVTGSPPSIYETVITTEAKTTTLLEIFQFIENNTRFRFAYNKNQFDLNDSYTCKQITQSLGDLLGDISNRKGLHFKQINETIAVSRKKTLSAETGKAPKGTGTIKGKVIDPATNEPLPGASVRIGKSANGTATDLGGEFRLVLKEGPVELEISYLGYISQVVEVEAMEGQTISTEIYLKSASTELDGLTVIGLTEGQAKALNQQKTADNIKNIVAADQINRFPDPNVAEALQRVPGVNIARDQGEGRYVLVRGLAPQFTNVSINGEQIPSPEADVRYVALDAIPADQLASIEVTKALTPDMDGDAIGGAVNLITRTARTKKPDLSASLAGGFNELTEDINFQGSLQYGQRVGKEGKFGYLINGSYYLTDRGSDNNEMEYDEEELVGLELRDYLLRRTRLGLSSTFDYIFSPNHEIYLRTSYNEFTDHEYRRRFIFNAEDAEIERDIKDRFEAQSVLSLNFGGKHSFSKLLADYEVSYAYAEQDTPDDISINFVGEFDDVTLDNNDPEVPAINVEGANYLETANYEFNEYEFGSTLAKDENITAKLNFSIPYSISGNESLFKFGGKVRAKEKSFRIKVNYSEWDGDAPLMLTDFAGGTVDNNFLDGDYIIGPTADPDKFKNFYSTNKSSFELADEDKLIDEALESYTATEDVYAAYVMTKMQFNKLMVLGGLRLENTQVKYRSKNVIINEEGDLEAIEDNNGSTDYFFLLPQFHVKYKLSPNSNIRAAATFSYARPNFIDIVPAQEFNLEDREVFIGNASLKPVQAFNLDLLGEHFFENVGIISGGVFYKRLDDFIFRRMTFGQTVRGVENVEVTQSTNGNEADLFGFELAYQQRLDFLPGILSGLGIYVNYTYTASTAKIQDRNDEMGEEEISLPGQADHVGNLSLSYEIKGFNARISSNFNGKYLEEVGGSAEEDTYTHSRMQLDFSASQKISPRLSAFVEVLNITNQPLQVYQGNSSRPIQREFYSWWSRVGVKFDL